MRSLALIAVIAASLAGGPSAAGGLSMSAGGSVSSSDMTMSAGSATTTPQRGPMYISHNPHAAKPPTNTHSGPAEKEGTVVVDRAKVSTEVFPMSCKPSDKWLDDGTPLIALTNTGGRTIPEGSTISVTWPNGKKTTFKVPYDVPPGSYFSIELSGGVKFALPFDCTAMAHP